MSRDPYDRSSPTRPKQPAQAEPRADDDPTTMVKCPTCAAVERPKLGCKTCLGAGYVSFERFAAMTCRCPTCVGLGRITHDHAAALEDDAKRKGSP